MTPRILLTIVLCVLSLPAHAQTLWQNTKAGMSLREFRQAYPAALKADDDMTFPDYPRGMETRADCDMYTVTQIFGKDFMVRFSFTKDALTRVALMLPGVERAEGEAQTLRATIHDALVEKYGVPDSMRSEESGSNLPYSRVSTWRTKDGVLIREYSVTLGRYLFQTILYSASESKSEIDKL